MSNISNQPHDKIVGKFMEDPRVAIDFFRHHLPDKALKVLDLSTLKATAETAISPKWKKLHNDIVFRCKTKDKKDVYVYLLIEHQSTPDRFMPLRMLRYKVNIWGKHLDAKEVPEKIPNIVSIVLYHGEKEYPYARDTFSCFQNPELARTEIIEPMFLLDLGTTDEDTLKAYEGADTILKILLKYSKHKDFIKRIHDIMNSNPSLFLSLSQTQAFLVFEYLMHIGKGTQKDADIMKEAFTQTYGKNKSSHILSLAEQFTLMGKIEGKREGKIEGKKEGRIEGKKEGKIEGKREGKIEGKREGKIEGKREGKIEGKREGKIEGKREGKIEGKREAIESLLKQGVITEKQARKALKEVV